MSEAASYPSFHGLSTELARLAEDSARSVVSVRSERTRSTGFVWKPGLIVTADEALAENGAVEITLVSGETVPAAIAGRDPTTDIALLRAERSDLASVTLATGPIPVGSLVLAVGSQDGKPTVMLGAVSASGDAWRSLRGGSIDARIELDLRLRHHAEGALVLDPAGHAVGMAVFGARRRILVIPASTIDRVAGRLEKHGRIARGYLGLGLQPVDVDREDGAGIMVMSVDPQGPGAAAGIRQGNVITAWDGKPVRGARTLVRSLGPDSVGSSLPVSLRRGGEPLEIRLTIGERPTA